MVAGSELTNPSLTFSPVATTGSSSFTYQVTNTQTELSSVVATADLSIAGLVNLCLGDKDACDKGRDDLLGAQDAASASARGGGLSTGAALTVAVSGPGDVGSSRPFADGKSYMGLVCAPDRECRANFVRGSTVLLYARPLSALSEFVEWGGDCRGTDPVALARAGTDAF